MRRFRNIFLPALLYVFLVACHPVGRDVPEVTQIEQLKHTAFVTTLENDLPVGKNVIYAPAFLYAWDELKKAHFDSQITLTDSNSRDFQLLNRSSSFQNSLNKNEYETHTSVNDGEITAEAFFHVSLPFASKMDVIEEGIKFGKTKVAAFGMNFLNDTITRSTQILFYENDDNFILKLIPRDTLHEIILFKGSLKCKTFGEAVKQVGVLIKNGDQDKQRNMSAWKYIFNINDKFSIPIIRMNLETNYKTLEGQAFSGRGVKYTVRAAYQRTALILDQKGAEVESEAAAALDSVGHPKNLSFNKPFLIIIKRIDKTNPYFVMKVENDELFTKK